MFLKIGPKSEKTKAIHFYKRINPTTQHCPQKVQFYIEIMINICAILNKKSTFCYSNEIIHDIKEQKNIHEVI